VAAQEQIEITRRNLTAAQRILKAIKDRFAAGAASGLDVAQQETLVANVAVLIPPLERNHQQHRYALAVLLGQAPELFRYKGEKFRDRAPVIPSGYLRSCAAPDIASAEAQLSAAKFNVSSRARQCSRPSSSLAAVSERRAGLPAPKRLLQYGRACAADHHQYGLRPNSIRRRQSMANRSRPPENHLLPRMSKAPLRMLGCARAAAIRRVLAARFELSEQQLGGASSTQRCSRSSSLFVAELATLRSADAPQGQFHQAWAGGGISRAALE
jgi:hypothetical protein